MRFFKILYAFDHLCRAILFNGPSAEISPQVRARSKEMLSRKSVDMNKKTICYGTFNGKRVTKLVSDNELDNYERHPEAFFGTIDISRKN